MSNLKTKTNSTTHSKERNSSEKESGLFQIGIITVFTAIVMMIVRMETYSPDMSQFFWSRDITITGDFFSLFKSQIIFALVVLAVLVMLYRRTTQSFYLNKTPIYIPMLIYAVFVALSYTFSAYREFALFGWNDRFEGTLILLSYMIMLFYIINTVNSEGNVKWIITPVAITTTLLGFIGVSQYYMVDFFKTTFGKMLITPSRFWDQLDKLNFNFEGGQIYQTVFNPNYVSLYLTLLVPLFAMLFIREKRLAIKCAFGFVYGLALFNLIGSASSNGILGLAMSFVVAVVVLNKRLIEWFKPILFLLLITVIVGSLTFSRFLPELTGSIEGATGQDSLTQSIADAPPNSSAAVAADPEAATSVATALATTTPATPEPLPSSYKLEYFETGKDFLNIGIAGDQLTIATTVKDSVATLAYKDETGKVLTSSRDNNTGLITLDDSRFKNLAISNQKSKGISLILIHTGKDIWPFAISKNGFVYVNALGKPVSLTNVPHFGFENNQSFGSYRGYIWSRSLPILKDTLIIGKGADTFCIYFPQDDYVGRYSADWTTNIIVDKAHNMYLATALNTGIISLLALLSLFGIYLFQSFRLYRKLNYTQDYLAFCGAGIFIGVSGFLVSAIFNDSSVSIMPLFYGLLGTGLAINRLILNK